MRNEDASKSHGYQEAWDGKSVLITGGTGSFGVAFASRILEECDPKRLVILSRDEWKQAELRHRIADPRVRWFLGDVRDKERLKRAFLGVDVVIHAAALKRVDTAEYDPFEYVKTNVIGSQNVIDVAIDSGVGHVIALSTDKASSPVNLYGATKLVADKLFVSGNSYGSGSGTKMAVVRYGNVLGSRGSVVPLFLDLARQGASFPITDERMTRFWISLDAAVRFVFESLTQMRGGELFVPKLPSMKVVDLARAISSSATLEFTGARPGEKLHEEMISVDDGKNTFDLGDRYVVAPILNQWSDYTPLGEPAGEGFSYRSDTNAEWLDVSDLRRILGLG